MADRYWVGGTGSWTTSTTNWSATSGGAGGATAPTAADNAIFDVNSNIGTGVFIVTVTSSVACLNLTISGLDGAMTLAGILGITVSGSMTLPATNLTWSNTGTLTFNATTAQTITTNGVTIASSINFNGAGGTWQLQTALTSSGSVVTLTSGTLDLNNYTLSAVTFNTTGSIARVIAYGTSGRINLYGSGTVWNSTNSSFLSYTGTSYINFIYNGATASTITTGTVSSALAMNFYISGAGTYVLTLTSGNTYNNLDFTGFTGTWAAGTTTHTMYGNLTIPATGGTFSSTAGIDTITFATNTGNTSTITTGNRTPINLSIAVNGAGTVKLADNFSQGPTYGLKLTNGFIDINNQATNSFGILTVLTGTNTIINGTLNCASVTHTSGTLNAGIAATPLTAGTLNTTGIYTFTAGAININNGSTLTVNSFSSTGIATRSISFGAGVITVNGSGATMWNVNAVTGLTYTGTPTVNISNSSTTAATITNTSIATTAFNFNINAGTYVLTLASGNSYNNLNFTSFAGTWGAATTTHTLYGNLTFPATGGTYTSTAGTNTFTLVSTVSGATATINTNGRSIPFGIVINYTGTPVVGTVQLTGPLTITDNFTLSAGTLDLNSFTLTAATFNSNNSNTRSILFGAGNISITGSIWNVTGVTGLTYTGTPTVNISNPTATATTITNTATVATAFNFNINAGTYALTMTSGNSYNNLNFTGFAGTWAAAATTHSVYGNLVIPATGGTFSSTAGIATIALANTSGITTITTNGRTIPFGLARTGAGGTTQLADNFSQSSTQVLTLTNGTLDLNSKTTSAGVLVVLSGTHAIANGTLNCASVTHTSGDLSIGTGYLVVCSGTYTHTTGSITINNGVSLTVGGINSTGTGVRSIGTPGPIGYVTTTGSGNAVNITGSNLSAPGTWYLNVSNPGSSATTVTNTATALALTIFINAGTYPLTLTPGTIYGIDFTGFNGTFAAGTNTYNIYGNLTLPATGGTFSATAGTNTFTWINTANTGTIKTNGRTIPFGISINGAGGTVQFADNFVQDPTQSFTLTNGTLDINNKTTSLGILTINAGTHAITNGTATCASVTHTSGDLAVGTGYNVVCTGTYTFTAGTITINNGVSLNVGLFSSSNINTRSIAFGTGNVTITGSGAVWDTTTPTGFGYTGTPTVNVANPTAISTTITTGALSTAQALDFNFTAGSYPLTLTTGNIFNNLSFVGFAGSIPLVTASITVYGNLAYGVSTTSSTTTGTITLAATTAKTITTNGATIGHSIIVNGLASTYQLQDAFSQTPTATFTLTNGTLDINTKTASLGVLTILAGTHAITNGTANCPSVSHTSGDLSIGTGYNVVCTGTYTFTAGTITINNGATLSVGSISSNNANVRSIAFGTGNITLTGSGTVWDTTSPTSFSYTGTPTVNVANPTAVATTVSSGPMTAAQVLDFNFTMGSYALTLATASYFNNLSFVGFVGSVPLGTANIRVYGNLTYGANTTSSSTTGTITLSATTAKTLTTNGATINHNITISGALGTYTLQDALTCPKAITLTAGSLVLNSYNITCLSMSITGTSTRTLNIGTGRIYVTGSATTVWNSATTTGLTIVGDPLITLSYSGATGTRTINTGALVGASAIKIAITAGTDTVTFTASNNVNNLDFTGFSGTWTNAAITCYGNLTLSPTMTTGAGTNTVTIANTSGITTITSNNEILDFPITINGVGGTVQLVDNLTQGPTQIFSLTNGTLDINSKTTSLGVLTINTGTHAISNGTLNCSSVNHVAGDLTTGTNALVVSTGIYTFAGGTITINNGVTLTAGAFSSNIAATRSIAFGTGSLTLNRATGGLIWDTTTPTSFSYTGTPTINIVNNSNNATTITTGPMSSAQALNFNFTTGSYALTLTTGNIFNNLSFAGFAGSVPLADALITVYGNLAYGVSTTSSTTTGAITLAATAAKTITTNGATIGHNIVLNGLAATYQLQDSTTQTPTATFTLTNGTLDINSKSTSLGILTLLAGTRSFSNGTLKCASVTHTAGDLTTSSTALLLCTGTYTFTAGTITILNGVTLNAGIFSSSNINVRSIAFGTGTIRLTSSGTMWDTSTSTSLSFTGTPNIVLANNSNISSTVNTTLPLSVSIATGTYTLVLLGTYIDLNFTGFAGTLLQDTNSITTSGNLTFSNSMVSSSSTGSITIAGSTSPTYITSNGHILGINLIISRVVTTAETWLADALTCIHPSGLSLNTGIFNTKNYNVTLSIFASIGAGVRTLTMGSSIFTILGVSWNTTSVLTVIPGTSIINMVSYIPKTFTGGGKTWYKLNQGGLGALTIVNNNTFNDISNTVQPSSVLFTTGSTTTLTNLSLQGTPGNLVNISSTTAGTHTLTKTVGTISLKFCSISYSIATGGASWIASTSNYNVNGGNNTGWLFAVIASLGNFFAFF